MNILPTAGLLSTFLLWWRYDPTSSQLHLGHWNHTTCSCGLWCAPLVLSCRSRLLSVSVGEFPFRMILDSCKHTRGGIWAADHTIVLLCMFFFCSYRSHGHGVSVSCASPTSQHDILTHGEFAYGASNKGFFRLVATESKWAISFTSVNSPLPGTVGRWSSLIFLDNRSVCRLTYI